LMFVLEQWTTLLWVKGNQGWHWEVIDPVRSIVCVLDRDVIIQWDHILWTEFGIEVSRLDS
jgi:hypothetical protein